MANLLEILAGVVGTMLVFALAAQSVQEILKTMLVIKGRTLQGAVTGLIREATRANRQWSIDADAIIEQVVRRLSALGQSGVRKGALRLDAITPDQLANLITSVEPADVPGLPGDEAAAKEILGRIGEKSKEWFPLAVAPVDDRYKRRMRVMALLSAALVVVPFNLDAFRVAELASSSPAYRAQVDSLVRRLDTTLGVAGGLASGAGTPGATPAVPDSATTDTLAVAEADSGQRGALTEEEWRAIRGVFTAELLGTPSVSDLRDPKWWAGILLSIALVSLGAPFWHDLLGTVFGLKRRLTAGAPGAPPAQPTP